MNIMSRKMKIIFTISIVLNVLLLGMAAGQFYHMQKRGHVSPWHIMKLQLLPETRVVMREAFKARKELVRESMAAMYEKSKAFEEVVGREIFDPVAYDVAAQELMDLGADISERRLDMFKSVAVQLPAEERKKIAKVVVHKVLGRPPGGRFFKKGERPDRHRPARMEEGARTE